MRKISIMKYIFCILILFSVTVSADVFLVEDDVISFQVPEECRKVPGLKNDLLLYVDADDKPVLVMQLFRGRQWSDWHLRGLKKSQETFQKFFDSELGGSNGEKLVDVSFIDSVAELNLEWKKLDGTRLLSRMKLTSFGCVAVHVPFKDEDSRSESLQLLGDTVNSLKIPQKYTYKPKAMASEIFNEVGSGFIFLILSCTYLMFSLFKRSQLHQRKLERRMKEVHASQLKIQQN